MTLTAPETVFKALHKAISDRVGNRKMTVSALDHETQMARRAYTSNGGASPAPDISPANEWRR